MEQSFEEYMNFFKSQPLKEKQDIILEQLKMLSTYANEMCNSIDVKNQILMNREMIDVNKENYTEDDFAEALIVYINSIQDSLTDFNDGIDELIDKLTQKN